MAKKHCKLTIKIFVNLTQKLLLIIGKKVVDLHQKIITYLRKKHC